MWAWRVRILQNNRINIPLAEGKIPKLRQSSQQNRTQSHHRKKVELLFTEAIRMNKHIRKSATSCFRPVGGDTRRDRSIPCAKIAVGYPGNCVRCSYTMICAGLRWIALWKRQVFRKSALLGYERVTMLSSLHACRTIWVGDVEKEGNSKFYQNLGLDKTIPL